MTAPSTVVTCHARGSRLGRPIARVAGHGISLGIYFGDPDGNGIA
jgi:catechol-2,3-dioxygenase